MVWCYLQANCANEPIIGPFLIFFRVFNLWFILMIFLYTLFTNQSLWTIFEIFRYFRFLLIWIQFLYVFPFLKLYLFWWFSCTLCLRIYHFGPFFRFRWFFGLHCYWGYHRGIPLPTSKSLDCIAFRILNLWFILMIFLYTLFTNWSLWTIFGFFRYFRFLLIWV